MSFPKGGGIFDNFVSQFLPKMNSFCAHQKGNFLNFSKLNFVSSPLLIPSMAHAHQTQNFVKTLCMFKIYMLGRFPEALS